MRTGKATRGEKDLSVVVAVKNGGQTLQRCISSVLQQTSQNLELIVVDGGSTDNTLDVLRTNQDRLAYWVSEPDKGISDAWNKGLAQARGDWIIFLGADDYLWDEDVCAAVSPALKSAFPKYRVAYGRVACVDSSGAVQGIYGQPWERARAQLLVDMSLPHQGVFHHRSLFESRGGFDTAFRVVGDYELLLRELKLADALFIPGIVVTGMQVGGLSSDPGMAPSIYWEFSAARKKNGLKPYPLAWQWRLTKAYLKRWLAARVGTGRTNALMRQLRSNQKPDEGRHD